MGQKAKPRRKTGNKKTRKPYWRESRGGIEVPNYIAAWRKFRGFDSQTQLAEASGIPSQTICRLENFSLAYTFLTLEKLAKVLKCEPGDLVSRDPLKDGRLLTQHKKMTPEQRERLMEYANNLLGEHK